MFGSMSVVLAQASGTASGGPPPSGIQQLVASMFPMELVFGILYLLLIRPQQTKAKEHSEMLSRLKAGDRVVTNGGVHGLVKSVKDKSVMLEVAKGVEVEFARAAIGTIMNKGGDSESSGR